MMVSDEQFGTAVLSGILVAIAAVGLALLGVAISFYDSVFIAILWRWFVVEQFPQYSIPALSVIQLVGLLLLARAVGPKAPIPKSENKEPRWPMTVARLLILPLFLLAGYIVKSIWM